MARIRYNHNSFSIGFLSKCIRGNTEFEGYNNALDECVNFVIQPTGGLFKRPGTYFVAEAHSDNPRLILFSYSNEDQYICEFGQGYIRYFTKYGPLLDENEGIVETKTNFSEDDVHSMTVQQDGNVLILVTAKGLFSLARTSVDEFTLTNEEYTVEPLTFTNYEKIALKPSTDSDETVTLTVVDLDDDSKKPSTKFAPFFRKSDVGHYVVLSYHIVDTDNITSIQRYYLKILEVQKDTEGFNKVVAKIDKENSYHQKNTLPSTSSVQRWQLGAFTEDRGTPKASACYEGRLFLANSPDSPTGIWGSSKVYFDWTDFFVDINDADAVMFKMIHKEGNEILWMCAQSKLFIGTRRGIYIAGSASFNDEAITPSNFRVRLFEATGASRLQPVEGCDSIFFVDVSEKKVHEIHFSAETTTYQADNISLLSSDLTLSGITSHAWQQNPIQTYWCTVRDGYLCSLTYLKNNGIMAWAKHVIMGNNVKVEQLCTMHGDENDLIWMVVRREVNGKFKRYIEFIHSSYDPIRQEEFKQFYVDSGVTKELKHSVKDIRRGKNPHLRINLLDRSLYDSIKEFISTNNGILEVAFKGGNHAPWNSRKRFFLLKPQMGHYFLSGNLFEYVQNGSEKFPVKISPADFSNLEKGEKCELYLSISTIMGRQEADIKCDTRLLNNGDEVIIFDSDIPGYESTGESYHVKHKTAVTVVLSDKHSHRIRPSSGQIFKKISTSIEVTVQPTECTIKLEDEIEKTAKRVYINKVSGMTQINARSYKMASISQDRKTITVYDEELSDKCGINAPLDAQSYSPFDRVNPDGNVYVYFNTMGNLEHLNGQMVDICADGNKRKSRVVSDGTIVFSHPVMYCSVGLAVKAYMKTMPFSGGSLLGSSVGAVGGQKSMWLHLYYSLGGRYGSESTKTYPIPYTNFISNFDKPKNLISGLIKCSMVNSKDIHDRSVYIEHTDPTAFNMLSLTQDIIVSDS